MAKAGKMSPAEFNGRNEALPPWWAGMEKIHLLQPKRFGARAWLKPSASFTGSASGWVIQPKHCGLSGGTTGSALSSEAR